MLNKGTLKFEGEFSYGEKNGLGVEIQDNLQIN